MTIRTILPVTIIATLGCAGFIALQAVHKPTTYKNNNISTSNSASFNDFDFTEYARGGRDKKYSITGKRLGAAAKRFGIFRIAAAKVTEIKDPRITFYDRNAPVSTIMGKTAVVDVPLDKINVVPSFVNSLEFSEGVSVVTADRRALDCNKLRWDKTSGRILASGNCVLVIDGKSVKADFIDSDVKLTDFSSRNDKMKRLRALTRAVKVY